MAIIYSEKIESYQVEIFNGSNYITLLLPGRTYGVLKFLAGDAEPETTHFTVGNAEYYHVHYPLTQYPHVIDILRNEKPVWFLLSDNPLRGFLRTALEAVGEEESGP